MNLPLAPPKAVRSKCFYIALILFIRRLTKSWIRLRVLRPTRASAMFQGTNDAVFYFIFNYSWNAGSDKSTTDTAGEPVGSETINAFTAATAMRRNT